MRMRTPTRRSRSGFTLIELLVVLLILAILMGISLPLYLRAVADSQLKTCRSNMHTIANAVQSARVKAQLTDYTTLAGAPSTTREPDLAYVPLCPNGGTYSVVVSGSTNDVSPRTIPSGSFAVECNFEGSSHGAFIPGMDSK